MIEARAALRPTVSWQMLHNISIPPPNSGSAPTPAELPAAPREPTHTTLQLGLPIATALRAALKRGYKTKHLRADILAGTVVGIVALPLSMALAIAVGAPPQHGLYTAMIAGAVTAITGGSNYQVTGPTAAFIVILAPIVAKFGLAGLMTAGFMAGMILIALGWLRLGALMRYIPNPVTTGFTTGIAVVIATLQVKDVLGLQIAKMPEHYHEKVLALWTARGTLDWHELVIAATTLGLLLLLPKMTRRIPAPLLAIAAAAGGAALWQTVDPALHIATIGSRFHTTINGITIAGIPPVLPHLALPWGADGLSFSEIRDLLPSAIAIAMLGAIESLLSAVIADGMTGGHHDPDAELVGQGLGNMIAPLFGGIAATGALARTATNIRAGARSPVAAVWHAVVILLSILLLAPLVAYIPMAALAGLLLLVAWNMSELRHFIGITKIAPKSDVSVLLICFGLTVVFDMVIAISVGFVLAAVLFMRRMAVLTDAKWLTAESAARAEIQLPRYVSLYQINGPLFFGAVHNAMGALHATSTDGFRVLILDLARVPVIDASGFAALESAVHGLLERNRGVVLAGPLPQPHRIWERAKMTHTLDGVQVADDIEQAIELAKNYLAHRTPTTQIATIAANTR